jgi:hypothetical protein
MALIPPQPLGVLPGSGMWNDWIEKIRSIVNTFQADFELTSNRDVNGGYAGLNSVGRIVKGVDTTDDVIIDNDTKGLVLKSPNAHYWRVEISDAGLVTWTDLGTTKP